MTNRPSRNWKQSFAGQTWTTKRTCAHRHSSTQELALCSTGPDQMLRSGSAVSLWPKFFTFLVFGCFVSATYCPLTVHHHKRLLRDLRVCLDFLQNLSLSPVTYYSTESFHILKRMSLSKQIPRYQCLHGLFTSTDAPPPFLVSTKDMRAISR